MRELELARNQKKIKSRGCQMPFVIYAETTSKMKQSIPRLGPGALVPASDIRVYSAKTGKFLWYEDCYGKRINSKGELK